MASRKLPVLPLAVAALVVAAVIGAGLHLAGDFVREKARQKGRARLQAAAPRVLAAYADRNRSLASALRLTAKQPTLRAAAATGDPLTLADNLAEVAERLEGSLQLWVDRGGPEMGSRLAVVLDRRGPAPLVHVNPEKVQDPREDLLTFGSPGGEQAPLPPSVSSTGWAVRALDPAAFAGELTDLLLARGEAADDATTGVCSLGEQLLRVATRKVRYEDGGPVGLLAAAAPLGAELAEELAREAGVRVSLAQPHGVRAPREGTVSSTVPLGRTPGGREILARLEQDLDSTWASLSLRDLEKPLFGGAVAAIVLGLLAIPLGVWLWISRPPGPITVPGAATGPAPEKTSDPFGRSAVARVLDLFPQERYGKPVALGRGGMGMVIKLEDSQLQRAIALKIMTLADTDEEVMRDLKVRFLREARTMASLSHPGLPGIHDVAEEPAPYFVMEFIEGSSLKEVFEEDGERPPEKVREWLVQAADALAHAHEKGIIHRDIKPDNLMLEPDGQVRVIDFGIALTEETTRVTREGYFVGTMGFISPEQLAHGEVDERADVYSLAATGYFMVTGKFPYSTPQLAVGKGFDPEPLPGDVDPVLAQALARALALEKDGRPESMAEFARLLRGEA